MFIIREGSVYQITRKSASKGLKEAIQKELYPYYNEKFLEEVVEEIMLNVSFPQVMDSNDVYLFQEGKLRKYVLKPELVSTNEQYEASNFSPIYSRPEVKEIANILEYSFDQLVYGQTENRNVMIVQIGYENYAVLPKENEIKKVAEKMLGEVLSKRDSTTVVDTIIQRFHSNNSVMFCLRRDMDIAYYRLMADGTCKKDDSCSTIELKKIIMRNLPNLKSILKKVEEIAIGLRNYILYGYTIGTVELTNPIAFEEEKAIFKINSKGIDFILDKKNNIWVSDYIKIRANEIEYAIHEKSNRLSNTEYYRKGTYKGFGIVNDISGDIPSENIPIIRDGFQVVRSKSLYEFYTYDKGYEEKEGWHTYSTNNFEAYIRVELK